MDDRFWPPPFYVMDRRNTPVEDPDRMVSMTTNPPQMVNPPSITVPDYHLQPLPAHASYSMSADASQRLTHLFPSTSGETTNSMLEKSTEFGKYPVTSGNQDYGRFPMGNNNLGFSSGHSSFPTTESGTLCPTLVSPEIQSLNLEKIYGTIESSRRNVAMEPNYSADRLLNLTGSFKDFVEKNEISEVPGINVGRTEMDVLDAHMNKQTKESDNSHKESVQEKSKDDKESSNEIENMEKTDKGETTVDKNNEQKETVVDKKDKVNSTGNTEESVKKITEDDEKKQDKVDVENTDSRDEESEHATSEPGLSVEEILKNIENECKKLADFGQEFILISINQALQSRFFGSDQGRQFLENNPDLSERFLSFCFKKEQIVESESDYEDEDEDEQEYDDEVNDPIFDPEEPSDSETLDEVVRRVVSRISKENLLSDEDDAEKTAIKKENLEEEIKEDTTRSKRKRKGVPRKLVRKVKKEKVTKKDLTCNICGRQWSTMSKLMRHQKSHTGEKSYACTMCDKKYTRLYNLKDHMNNHKLKERQDTDKFNLSEEDIKRLQCVVCQVILSSSSSLTRHMMLHTDEVLKSCEKCGKKFKRTDTYKIHMAKCGIEENDVLSDSSTENENDDEKGDDADYPAPGSKDSKKRKCEICGKRFKTRQACKAHIKLVHLDKDRYSCPNCDHKFSTKSHLKRHMSIHDNSGNYFCQKCRRAFKYEKTLNEHVCKHVTKGNSEGKHPCEQCGKEFNRRKNLLLHIRTHMDLPAKHKCDICGKAFRDSSNLKKHVRFVHSSRRDFICDICGKGFKQNDTLKIHVQSHNPVKTDKYKCKICGKLLSGSTALNVHERSHLNIKPFVCDVCGLSFSQSGNLQKHLLSHTDMKFHTCEICHKEFKYIETWKAHQRAHALKEGREDASKFGKVYTCEYCGKKCATASQHKVHLRTHTNERPFPCNYCGKSFKESGKLQRHKKTHLSNSNRRVVVHDIKIETPITIKNYYSHHPETNQTFYNM